MKCHSVQPSARIFVTDFGVLSFAKIMSRNVDKNISKSLSSKYNMKFLDYAKQSSIDASKIASRRAI